MQHYHPSWLESKQAYLSHGDFSIRQIYQDNGRYTGIIDFGDSRGANSWYDLGYFHMREHGLLPYSFAPALLRGYSVITILPPDYEDHIRFASLLILVPMLARSLQKHLSDHPIGQRLTKLREDLTTLCGN